jgi:hypothetical protein
MVVLPCICVTHVVGHLDDGIWLHVIHVITKYYDFFIPEPLHDLPKRRKILFGELWCDPQQFQEEHLGSCQLRL